MRRFFISLMLLLCFTITAVAVPAKPGWHTVNQSDGTTLQVQAVGNAFNHALLTSDGLMVALADDGDFYYTSSLTGLTAVRAHEVKDRTASETAFIEAQRSHLTMQPKEFKPIQGKSAFGIGGSNADADVPAHGTRKVPIILVEYKDKKFKNTREQIISALLTGNTSVQQYFKDQSNGKYDPDFEVFGIYTLSQNRQYYGGNVSGNDKGLGSMVTEACQLAAADGVSFSPFDTNNDNYCDVVIVIYAGVGESQASYTVPDAIWPCNWTLTGATISGMGGNGAFRPNGSGPYVNNFAVFNEIHGSSDNGSTIDGIGTFCHEFGHCLGLPDFYDTNYGGHYGMGYWDIMDTGCYANDTYTPVGYSAYEKNFMGWVDYVIPSPATYYTLPVWNQKSEDTDKALLLQSDINSNEFFIIENRRLQGWDRYLPAQGMLIHHITYNAGRWDANTPNNQNIQLITIMPADNSLSASNESGDTWPRSGKTEFTDNSTPAAKLNMTASGNISGNAGYLGKPVTEMVINNDGTASFWYMKGAITEPTIEVSDENVNCGSTIVNTSVTKTFTVTGKLLTGNISLALNDPNGVFTVNPTVINSSNAANGVTVTVTFSPKAIRSYEAALTLTSNGAETVTVNLTGQGRIEGYTPVMQPAAEDGINQTSFRADWTDQTPAQNVESYTLEVMLKPAGTELIGSLNASAYPGSSYEAVTLPAPWGGTNVRAGYSEIYFRNNYDNDGSYGNITYTIPEGNHSMTYTLKVTSYGGNSDGIGNLTVSTPHTDAVTQNFTAGTTRYWLVTADPGDMITITTPDDQFSPSVSLIEVYAGDARPATLNASEAGDDAYRLITGITEKSYIVENLAADGTFYYRVKAQFTDGSVSTWSNVEEVTLFQNSHLERYTPVMQPAAEEGIKLTSFRADWTDQTPENNVESYTLEVNLKTIVPELIGSLNGTAYPGNSYVAVTLPAPWGGTNVFAGYNEIYFRNNYNNDGSYGNFTFTIPEGYTNKTFTLKVTSYAGNSDGIGNLTVATPQTAAVTQNFTAGATRYWLVTASSGEQITITTPDAQFSPSVSLMEVYTGDARPEALNATEAGDANYRLITGITDKSYMVENLTADGTFVYRVKAHYVDGTVSAWSNEEEVTLFQNSDLETYDPVMQPAAQEYINLTEFRADWTDQTPENNVESYTLEVNIKPFVPELIGSISSTSYPGNEFVEVTLPEPWGGTNVRAGYGEIYFRNNYNNDGSYGNFTFTIPEGYNTKTYTVRITSYGGSNNGIGNLTVATPQTAAVTQNFTAGATRYWLVTANAGEVITITTPDANFSPSVSLMEVYTGDVRPDALNASETGDTEHRVITGITDKFYTVKNLEAEGTYLYKVRAHYVDGTQSAWSNMETVTLFDNGPAPHEFAVGDVNHDRDVNIADVTALIDHLLGLAGDICEICADVNGDHEINIADVTTLIDRLLGIN